MKEILKNDRLYLLLGGVFLAIVFYWPLRVLLSENTFAYGPFLVNLAVLSDLLSWLPISEGFFSGDLFSTFKAQSFALPLVSISIQSFLLGVFGESGSYFVGRLVFVGLSLFLFYRLFVINLPKIWAFSLALFSLFCYTTLPFRSFLTGLGSEVTNNTLEIFHFPFPAISLTFFLLALNWSVRLRRIDKKKALQGTLVWVLQFFVHPLNFLVGVPVWLTTVFLQVTRSRAIDKRRSVIKIWAVQIAMVVIFCLITLGLFTSLFQEFSQSSEIQFSANKLGEGLGLLYSLIYFILPLGLTVLFSLVQKIDLYDLIHRFYYVFILLMVEVLGILVDTTFFGGQFSHLLFSRLFIFLHFLYFVPFIYYMSSPQVLVPRRGIEAKPASLAIKRFLQKLLGDYKIFYLPMTLLLLGLFLIRQESYHGKAFVSEFSQIAYFDEIGSDRFVTEDLLSNLTPKKNQLRLWPNQFVSKANPIEGTTKIAVYAKLFGWSFEDFYSFMRRGFLDKQNYDAYLHNDSRNLADSGLGNWLVFHTNKLVTAKVASFSREQYQEIYQNAAPKQYLQDQNVVYIVTRRPLQNLTWVTRIKTQQGISLYKIHNSEDS